MNLTELKKKAVPELLEIASEMGLDNLARSRKQDVIFTILKRHAKGGEDIYGDGVLEILQDGFGFFFGTTGPAGVSGDASFNDPIGEGADEVIGSPADSGGPIFVQNGNGEMVPLSTLVTVKKISGPDYTTRFNLFRSVEVTGAPAPGYTSAQAMTALEEVAEEVARSPQSVIYDEAENRLHAQKAILAWCLEEAGVKVS